MTLQKLPNATAVLVLGIVSIVSCWCYGIIGIITGIIALVLYKKDKTLYNQNPGMYDNYSQLSTGRILAIIGLILSILFLIYMIVMIGYIGMDALTNPELMQERMRDLQNQ